MSLPKGYGSFCECMQTTDSPRSGCFCLRATCRDGGHDLVHGSHVLEVERSSFDLAEVLRQSMWKLLAPNASGHKASRGTGLAVFASISMATVLPSCRSMFFGQIWISAEGFLQRHARCSK